MTTAAAVTAAPNSVTTAGAADVMTVRDARIAIVVGSVVTEIGVMVPVVIVIGVMVPVAVAGSTVMIGVVGAPSTVTIVVVGVLSVMSVRVVMSVMSVVPLGATIGVMTVAVVGSVVTGTGVMVPVVTGTGVMVPVVIVIGVMVPVAVAGSTATIGARMAVTSIATTDGRTVRAVTNGGDRSGPVAARGRTSSPRPHVSASTRCAPTMTRATRTATPMRTVTPTRTCPTASACRRRSPRPVSPAAVPARR